MRNSELEEVKKYHQNGELWVHSFYKDGKVHGECKRYHENGGLDVHCVYKDGKLHGECETYYDNGERWLHCFFKAGGRHGEFKRFRENGELAEHFFFYDAAEEELSDYVEDINNITDDEFMNLSMVFGINFFASESFIGAAS